MAVSLSLCNYVLQATCGVVQTDFCLRGDRHYCCHRVGA